MTKRAVILGASGMVGQQVLSRLLDNSEISEVISIERRPSEITHPKLKKIQHQDFSDFSALENQLKDIDLCYYCVGVYQGQVSKQDFMMITCDYLKAFIDTFSISSPKATFALFSAEGADRREKSRITFSLGKGRAENILNRSIFPNKYHFRAGYIQPTGIKRPTELKYKLTMPIADFFMKFFPNIGSTDQQIAKAMVQVSLEQPSDKEIYSRTDINRLN